MVLRLKTRESRSLPGLQSATHIFSKLRNLEQTAGRNRGPFLLLALRTLRSRPAAGSSSPRRPAEAKPRGPANKKSGHAPDAQDLSRGGAAPADPQRPKASRTGKLKKTGQAPEAQTLSRGGAAPADPQRPKASRTGKQENRACPEAQTLSRGGAAR